MCMVTWTEYPISISLFRSYYFWKLGQPCPFIVCIALALNIPTLNMEILNSLAEYIGKYESCSADRDVDTYLLLNNYRFVEYWDSKI